jgi:hypothetical protein
VDNSSPLLEHSISGGAFLNKQRRGLEKAPGLQEPAGAVSGALFLHRYRRDIRVRFGAIALPVLRQQGGGAPLRHAVLSLHLPKGDGQLP